MYCTEKYTPQRSGLRERRRAESPTQREPSIVEKWTPEEELELWEIKLFAEKSVLYPGSVSKLLFCGVHFSHLTFCVFKNYSPFYFSCFYRGLL